MERERGRLRAHFELGEAFAELVGEGAEGGVFEDELFHCFGAGGWVLVVVASSGASEDGGRRLGRFARVDEFVVVA